MPKPKSLSTPQKAMTWSMGNIGIFSRSSGTGGRGRAEVREEQRRYGAHCTAERGAECAHMRGPEAGWLGDHTVGPRRRMSPE
eukprot:7015538-Heterocapsa_arctica.AAC.1